MTDKDNAKIKLDVPLNVEPENAPQYDEDVVDCWVAMNPGTCVPTQVVPLDFYMSMEEQYNQLLEQLNAQADVLADYAEAHEMAKQHIVEVNVKVAELRIENAALSREVDDYALKLACALQAKLEHELSTDYSDAQDVDAGQDFKVGGSD